MVEKIEKNVLTAWERVEIARNPKRKTALDYINEIFDEDFKSLDEYKEEKNFKRVVEQITLEDIINAIKRADTRRDSRPETVRSPFSFSPVLPYPSTCCKAGWERRNHRLPGADVL